MLFFKAMSFTHSFSFTNETKQSQFNPAMPSSITTTTTKMTMIWFYRFWIHLNEEEWKNNRFGKRGLIETNISVFSDWFIDFSFVLERCEYDAPVLNYLGYFPIKYDCECVCVWGWFSWTYQIGFYAFIDHTQITLTPSIHTWTRAYTHTHTNVQSFFVCLSVSFWLSKFKIKITAFVCETLICDIKVCEMVFRVKYRTQNR